MKLRTDESARQKEGGQTSREAECEYGARERDRQTDRDRDRDRDRQRQTDRQKDRQTDRQTMIMIPKSSHMMQI